jgi:hypothetical protein
LRLAVVLAAAVALTGCGGSGDPVREVREATVVWLSALAASDGAGACELLAPELAEQARPSCEVVYGGHGEVLGETLGAAGLAFDDVVGGEGQALAITVEGDQATVELPSGTFLPIKLRHADEGWRVVRGLRPA